MTFASAGPQGHPAQLLECGHTGQFLVSVRGDARTVVPLDPLPVCVVAPRRVAVVLGSEGKGVFGSFCCLAVHLRCVLYTEEGSSVSSS